MTIRWGILGTGNIAKTFAQAVLASPRSTLAAVASRTQSNARNFAAAFKLDDNRAFSSYQSLLDSAQATVDVLYIATPHSEHREWAHKALQLGIGVLCEKPLTLNHADTMLLAHTARQNNTFLMEALMYTVHPQTQSVLELIQNNAIGQIHHIDAAFGFQVDETPNSRLFAPTLGGGAILDVGCYPLSLANMVYSGTPQAVHAEAQRADSGVDKISHALMRYSETATASLSSAVTLSLNNTATIYGSEGRIHLLRPWLPDIAGSNGPNEVEWAYELIRSDTPSAPQMISGTSYPLYVSEIEHVAECLLSGEIQSPVHTWQASEDLATGLDQWRAAIGLQYPEEAPKHYRSLQWRDLKQTNQQTKSRQSPAKQEIPTATLPGLTKPVSRLVMGCDNQPSMAHAATIWDYYFLNGGNCFDTAFIYGDGRMEELLGEWQQQRDVRDQIIIIGKGAHTPHNAPQFVEEQLTQSLQRLQTTHVDLYFLHRDNPAIPVEQFIDTLNKEADANRLTLFGASNWTTERALEANNYAAQHGLRGFSALSNNFSLATMVRPLWPGVEIVKDDELHAIKDSGMALFPWSSQARGFFTAWTDEVSRTLNEAQIDNKVDTTTSNNASITLVQPTMQELVDTWFSDANFARRSRAEVLAKRKGASLINIALSYVLNQDLLTFPLIGPRHLREVEDCIAATRIELSPTDVGFLRDG